MSQEDLNGAILERLLYWITKVFNLKGKPLESSSLAGLSAPLFTVNIAKLVNAIAVDSTKQVCYAKIIENRLDYLLFLYYGKRRLWESEMIPKKVGNFAAYMSTNNELFFAYVMRWEIRHFTE